MNSSDLYDLFRSDVVDLEKPYLWSDREVFIYMNDAYKMFWRLLGGIGDFTSEYTRIKIAAGQNIANYDKRIMRFMTMFRMSDQREIDIINEQDLPRLRGNDYGQATPLWADLQQGPVTYAVIGSQRGKVQWIQVPIVDDVAKCYVYRLPLTTIDGLDIEFDEVDEHHVFHFLKWMKHLAYQKQDTETFNKSKSDEMKTAFENYCALCAKEIRRERSKGPRAVAYGGVGQGIGTGNSAGVIGSNNAWGTP